MSTSLLKFNPREEAETLWLLYAMGMIDFAEIISWADAGIQSMTDPHVSIIELALLKDPRWPEVQQAIQEIPGTCDFNRVGTHVLKRVKDAYEAGEFELEIALQKLKAFFSWAQLPEEVWYAFDQVDDDHWLEKSGIWGAGVTNKNLRIFLEKYTKENVC